MPGVERVETRVGAGVKLEVEGFTDPITGLLLSLPDRGERAAQRLHFKRGRWLQPVQHRRGGGQRHLRRCPPASSRATRSPPIINGKRKQLTVVGVAVSPEYVYQIAPGAMFPDFKRYGVLWMGRNALAAAYDMEGAFNQVTLS